MKFSLGVVFHKGKEPLSIQLKGIECFKFVCFVDIWKKAKVES